MGFDDWGIGVETDWDPSWEDPDWVEAQEEVELTFNILVHTTGKAYLLQFGEENVWFPMSKATLNMSMHKNTVLVPRWLMIEKGLEEYCADKSVVKEKTETEELFNKVVRKNIRKLEEDIPF